MRPASLTPEQWMRVLDGLALGEYSLILGAGASLGSVNSSGDPLPKGSELADLLREEYSLPTLDGLGLRRVYDLCEQVAPSMGLPVPALWLSRFFAGCSVPGWYRELVQVPWRVIWNLNIDDVLATAYNSTFSSQSCQKLRTASWKDRWSGIRQAINDVSMIQLHGSAAEGDLIFGTLEYLSADASGGAAHRIFRDEWQNGVPRLILGASLDDELDIAAPLASTAPPNGAMPSISVKPTFSDIERLTLSLQGILPVEMTAEQFFKSVADDWAETLSRIQGLAPAEYRGVSPTQLAFLQNFAHPDDRADRLHDFFSGDEPLWHDIVAGYDAARVLQELTVHPADVFPARGLRVVVFHGNLSGASTAELRFLKQCADAGSPYMQHRGDVSFKHNVIHNMARHGFRKVLRVPDLDDFPEALGKLKAVCDQSGVPIVVVSSVRTQRLRGLGPILGDSLVSVRVPERLTPSEVDSVLEALRVHNRENLLLGLSDLEKRRFITDQHRGDLIDALAAVSRGRAFSARYSLALREVTDPQKLLLLQVVLLCGELGFDVSIGLLSRTIGLPAREVAHHLQSESLNRLLAIGRSGVTARHKGLAARASGESLSTQDRYHLTQLLAISLSPYVSPVSISARSREARMCGALMDARRVVGGLGAVEAARWYQELERDFGWNARFWEQRALAELMASEPRYEKAESWAREAVERHRDPFSLNTLATVLLRRSTSGVFEEELFFEGLEFAEEARRTLGEREDEHPFVTAISYLAKARVAARAYPDLRRRLDVLFAQWQRNAHTSKLWTIAESHDSMERSIQQYLRAVAMVN